jgi:putative transposase
VEYSLEKSKRAKRCVLPKHDVEFRSFKFPLILNKRESDKLFAISDLCLLVRNQLAQDREDNRSKIKEQKAKGLPKEEIALYLNRAAQYKTVSALQKTDSRFKTLHSQVLQNIADRVDKSTKAWLTHIAEHKSGKKSPPGQVIAKHCRSFSFPEYGKSAFIRKGVVHLPKIGDFKVNAFRKLKGQPKTLTIKFTQGKWWVIVSCQIQTKDLYRTSEQVKNLPDLAGDPGLGSLITLSDGTIFNPSKPLKDNLSKLRTSQQDMSRKFEVRKELYKIEQERRKLAKEELLPYLSDIPYSKRLIENIKQVAKLHTKVSNIRDDNHKKIASIIEDTIRCLGIEEHGIKFMFANRKTARSAADRGIANFKEALKAKLGSRYIPVENQRAGIGGNSQTCLCNEKVPKQLKDRIHVCPNCGLTAPRDVVSANIVQLIAFGTHKLQFDESKILNIIIPKQDKTKPKKTKKQQTEAGLANVSGDAQRHGEIEVVEQIVRTMSQPKKVGFRDFDEVSISVIDKCVSAGGEPMAIVKNQAELVLQNIAGTFPCETKPHFEHVTHVREPLGSLMKHRH